MKVLIVEEDNFARKVIDRVCKKMGLETVYVEEAGNAPELISKGNVHIAVIGGDMAAADGLDLCVKIRKLRLTRYVYLILMGSKSKKGELVSALNGGADDYMVKPFDEEELAARLRVGLRIHRLENKLVNSQKKLMKLAKEDPLTKTLNRRALLDDGLREMNRASREKGSIAVMLVDVREFRAINEKFGNLAGDLALIEFTRRLEECCREYDRLGRYSDKDFLLILPKTDRDGALIVAERILKELSEWPLQYGKSYIELAANIGIAAHRFQKAGRDQTVNESIFNKLIDGAEQALLSARDKGKNELSISGG